MATITRVEHVDDLDPARGADETVTFGMDGATFEIDLAASHADELRAVLAPYVEAGRRTGGRRKRGAGRRNAKAEPHDAG